MKKYAGKTLSEAFSKAKAAMGEDVIIFNTEYLRTDSGTEVEILVSAPKTEEVTLVKEDQSQSVETKKVFQGCGATSNSTVVTEEKFKSIEDKLNYLTESVLFMNANLPDRKQENSNYKFYDYLIKRHHVEDVNAKKIINKLTKENAETAQLREILENLLDVEEGIQCTDGLQKRVAFVGPTGVGKTTTIAKVAAYMSFTEKKKVGVICMDSYRIGAEAQLRLYGDIMNVPVFNAANNTDLKNQLDNFRDKDIILIDTAGKSQHSGMQLMEIANSLKSIEGIETYLTLPLNMRDSDIADTIRNFKVMNYSRIIFTKIDETRVYGALLNVFFQTGIGVSYITCGQNVPEDIIIPNKKYVIDVLLKDLQPEMEMAWT